MRRLLRLHVSRAQVVQPLAVVADLVAQPWLETAIISAALSVMVPIAMVIDLIERWRQR